MGNCRKKVVKRAPIRQDDQDRNSRAEQQQGPAFSAIEIDGKFLALHSWQFEGEQRIVGHDGCGAEHDAKHFIINTDLLRGRGVGTSWLGLGDE